MKIKQKLQELLIGAIFGGIIGWGIATYMDRPDISYYSKINQYARIDTVNSTRVLTSWYRRWKNSKRGTIFSSSVYIRNTGYHAYKGADLSRDKNPLRIESDKPIKLFTVNDTQSPETKVSVIDKNGIYFIDFDFINNGKSLNFVFTHSQPVKYIHVKGSGIDLPYIREKQPFNMLIYTHPYLILVLFVFASILCLWCVSAFFDKKINKEEQKLLSECWALKRKLEQDGRNYQKRKLRETHNYAKK